MALPLLDRFTSRAGADEGATTPRRLVFVCTSLGMHGPNFFPVKEGRDYEESRYLKMLAEHRNDFTVFSGVSHPDQAGADGHSSERTWLTGAPHPGLSGFRNTISVDQFAAERLGYVTRFPSLVLGSSNNSQSCTASGVTMPAMSRPSKLYAELFLEGSQQEIQKQIQKLSEGRSILDSVAREAKRLALSSSAEDRQRLDEYFQSVRDMEQRLQAAQSWVNKPKPVVDARPPKDIDNESDLIGRTELMFELIPLALQTDSTRVISMLIQGRGDVPVVEGVSMEHHGLSHHGQDPEKLAQLERVESAQMKALAKLFTSLATKTENGSRLMDSTSLLFGSNLGNANNHDWHNLPILLAGGGFKHGTHRVYDKENNLPLSNLFLTMLQSQGHEIDQFSSSTSTVSL